MKKILCLVSAALFLTVCLTGCSSLKAPGKAKYMVVDLLSSGVSYTDVEPVGGWSEEYKTTKLALRRIEPGTFAMGSPEDELGRRNDETQHEVTLTRPFYIGIFEITQKQYQLITGGNPSVTEYRGDAKPVDNVSYNDIRGAQKGAQWPANNEVDEFSFFGKLRARTKLDFDLPTEAQWEFACRAGTTTALNDGNNLADIEKDDNLNKLGRYSYNGGEDDGTAVVGSYLPNAWGLYDMHGNVSEWCLDWWDDGESGSSDPVTDPVGPAEGYLRLLRGGSFCDSAGECRSAYRFDYGKPYYDYSRYGFRVVLVP